MENWAQSSVQFICLIDPGGNFLKVCEYRVNRRNDIYFGTFCESTNLFVFKSCMLYMRVYVYVQLSIKGT